VPAINRRLIYSRLYLHPLYAHPRGWDIPIPFNASLCPRHFRHSHRGEGRNKREARWGGKGEGEENACFINSLEEIGVTDRGTPGVSKSAFYLRIRDIMTRFYNDSANEKATFAERTRCSPPPPSLSFSPFFVPFTCSLSRRANTKITGYFEQRCNVGAHDRRLFRCTPGGLRAYASVTTDFLIAP